MSAPKTCPCGYTRFVIWQAAKNTGWTSHRDTMVVAEFRVVGHSDSRNTAGYCSVCGAQVGMDDAGNPIMVPRQDYVALRDWQKRALPFLATDRRTFGEAKRAEIDALIKEAEDA